MEDNQIVGQSSPSEVREIDITNIFNTQEMKEKLFTQVMYGNWDIVVAIYNERDDVRYAKITRSKETAVHIAISDNKIDVAKRLLELVDANKIKDMKNERGNNPLHVAAALGQEEMCTFITKKDPKLVHERNEDGETPLFLAALHGKKGTFYALHKCHKKELHIVYDIIHCKRNVDGNSILHVAILGEYFELAFQIAHWYPDLCKYKNETGHSPLQLLANNPSAFRSGWHLGPLDNFIYASLMVEHLKLESPSDLVMEKNESPISDRVPENYRTCFDLLEIIRMAPRLFAFHPNPFKSCQEEEGDVENLPRSSVSSKKSKGKDKHQDGNQEMSCNANKQKEQDKQPECEHKHLEGDNTKKTDDSKKDSADRNGLPTFQLPFPQNYFTFFKILEIVLELFLFIFGLGFFKVKKLRQKKRMHTCAFQVMQKLVSQANLWEYEETGSQPLDLKEIRGGDKDAKVGALEISPLNIPDEVQPKMGGSAMNQDHQVAAGASTSTGAKKTEDANGKQEKSPFLMASKMGVLEMVEEILKCFPVAIDDENQDKKNVVLLAAENRQPRVYTFLQNKYSTKESVFQKVDKAGNSAPHLAATFGKYQPWMIPGAALQMQWEIKWFEFINESMPRHFFTRLNKEGKTPKEVFTVQHTELIKAGGEWLTHTSESCSVVAALIATVAFASAITVPGGVKAGGEPTFEGKPAFNLFAISSLVALCFSTTALTMFLSILTSRYQVSDFHYSLPTKLILGLTTLFVSIASMLVSFCAGHFFVLSYQLKYGVFLVYGITCLPVTLFAIAQFPLYLDLLKSTTTPVPKRSYEVVSI
ncbi:hypothetical protein AAC387_Pa12g1540 [Persea americana]